MQVLSFIASRFISEYENVANAAIAHLLNGYQQARDSLKQILNIKEIPQYFELEVSTEENGRPDVTGFDIHGNKSVIIEGKFWANLTSNQPNNYLKELKSDGKILFLAPSKRIEALKNEITKRVEKEKTDKIIIISWDNFLSIIAEENKKNFDSKLESDLIQIKELCNKMDIEGMPPLSYSDLDAVNGRLYSNFVDVIDECNLILKKNKNYNFKGYKITSTKYGYGFYFRYNKLGCFLSFDTNNWYKRKSFTPIWIRIKKVSGKKWVDDPIIRNLILQYDADNAFKNEYSIQLKPGMDKAEVIKSILNRVDSLLKFLDNHI